MNPYEDRYDQAEALYCLGYLADLEYSPYTRRALADGAKEDFNGFVFSVEEVAAEKAYNEGYQAAAYETDQSAEQQGLLIAKLQKELDEKNSSVLAELSFYLGESLKTNATPTHDVELWAYQDGWNEVIQRLMKKIVDINAAKQRKV